MTSATSGVRRDVVRRAPEEDADAYYARLYLSLEEGQIAHGWRRCGEALEHVWDYLEYLDQFEAADQYE